MNKGISFFIGLIVGVLCCILLFYFDIKFFEAQCPTCDKKEIVTLVQTDTVYIETPSKPKRQNIEDKIIESAVEKVIEDERPENENNIYESDFSFDEAESDEVFSDKLLQTKTVKVRVLAQEKQEVKLPDNFFQFFEIQQWSTPIKNKVSYNRDKNMVKIKGMDIDNVSIVFWAEAYFLETGNRYYAIPETGLFEKLNLVQIPQ